MLQKVLAPIMVVLRVLALLINLLVMAILFLYPVLILKIIFHVIPPVRNFFGRIMVWCVEQWTRNNHVIMNTLMNIEWDVEINGDLDRKKSYLAVGNHQAWMDIFVMQRVYSGKTPLPRFFIKHTLIYLPILGLAWWGLDMPFMKRYTKEYLAKHPEKKGEDLAATIRACQKFKHTPVTLINYLEGTRITPEKHKKQQSPYKHLLKPKSGGVAFAIQVMDGAIEQYMDTTIYYPSGEFSFGDFLLNRMKKVVVRVDVKDIPKEFLTIDYENNEAHRAQFQAWISQNWKEKDALLDEWITQNTDKA